MTLHTGFPHFQQQKIPGLFQDRQNVFPGPAWSAIPRCKAYGMPNILKFIITVVYFEVELPVNSSTIQDLHIPVLSTTLRFHFQDFPGLENSGKISRTFPAGCMGTLSITYRRTFCISFEILSQTSKTV